MKSDQCKNTAQGQCTKTPSKMPTADESDARRVRANVAATANAIVIAKRRAERRIDINEPAKRRADGNTRRADAKVAAIARKLTKKRADAKIVATANKTAIVNINEPANNARSAHANVVATADANVMAVTNKATSNTRKVHANVMARSNGSNARRARINKAATVDEGDTRSACQYSGYHRRNRNGQEESDANIVTTANVRVSDARTSANIAVNANANKTASNIRKRVPMYRRPQMPT